MKFMGVILVEVVVEEGDEESEGGLRSGGHSPEAAPCLYKVIIDKDMIPHLSIMVSEGT